MPEDLDAAEALHGVRVGEGDIVFVRTGAGRMNTYLHASGSPRVVSAMAA